MGKSLANRRLLVRGAVAFAAACLAVAPAASASAAAPSAQDTQFLQAAHQSNLAEIATGELAQQKGQSQQVKQLGARFVADHTRLDQAVTQTSSALAVELPDTPNAEQRAAAARLQAASGAEFDALWLSLQMEFHMKAMALGEKELANGSDPQAKTVARNAAPVIKAHHDGLRSAARELGVPDSINTGSGGLAAPGSYGAVISVLVAVGVVAMFGAVLLRRRAGARR